ncbi:hypothetical protein GUITHDRAFT_166852 [Guillardia theta CCMP2712]|uniref:EF-hand domain-containing protein n=1 Tax=Guillardia theta (strain CCMP2712) TaxID=905079 RepID=L1I5V9_GUITC|nr:hypothetical protein GUITHDRAFT_166852 [Guillardia theta CCMP2712]EKX31631.1 hypothetical protein GUITHDRAFT_166852 [Guillardia theta CCMP2712]|eukprot:XP_005818611.1 hypothetical protein GUITHDRAFT_166852 [Guillardia theta CCMP2712]
MRARAGAIEMQGGCGGRSICEHGRVRSQCKECGGRSICEHGRVRSRCKECGGRSICEHGRVRSGCKECGGSSICEHGRRRSKCKGCGGRSICEHGRQRSRCKGCGGGSICEHGRQRSVCKECWGSSICEHGRQRSGCKGCGGRSICEHGRERSQCKECGGRSICEHGREEIDKELKKIEEEIETLRKEHEDVFHKGDKDKDGLLSLQEFMVVQHEDQPEMSKEELEESFADHDADGSGGLTLEEWRKPFEDTVQNIYANEEEGLDDEHNINHYRREFEAFDKDADGFLDLAELEELAKEISKHHGNHTVTGEDILRAVDNDADGKVNLEEYLMDGQEDEELHHYPSEHEDDPDASDISLEKITSDDDLGE